MVLNPQKGIHGQESWWRGEGGAVMSRMSAIKQVTYEELSSGEHAHDPGAVLPPDASPGPAALIAAERPLQSERRKEKDSTPGAL